MIHTQFGERIKRFRLDNARDYFNQNLSSFFKKEGIIHESSCVETPQQNGVAEIKNRHLLGVARALLFQSNAPKSLWGEAVLTATYFINHLPSRVLENHSPINILSKHFSETVSIRNLPPKVFGCTVFLHVHKNQRSKLDPRAKKCMFVGYSATQKGYKCYDPSSRRTFVSLDVTFNESEPFYKSSPTHLQGEQSKEEDACSGSISFLEINTNLLDDPSPSSFSTDDKNLETAKEVEVENVSAEPISDEVANHKPENQNPGDSLLKLAVFKKNMTLRSIKANPRANSEYR